MQARSHLKQLGRKLRPYLDGREVVLRILRVDLGTFYQYRPRPLRIPRSYYDTRPPTAPPKISIVTPCYNSASFIEATIKSVIDQDYPNIQYICQDGASTDGSAKVIARFADKLHHWESKPDGGQTHAINHGFCHADGDILAYLNSDDLLLPGALGYIASYFSQHPNVDVVYGHRIIVDEHGDEIGRWIVPAHDAEVLRFADYVPQETLFWRRRIWEKVGGNLDESFQFAIDWDLLLRMQDAGAKMVRLPRFLGAFRAHSTQKSQAEIHQLGLEEMTRLRKRATGHVPDSLEIRKRVQGYIVRHAVANTWWHLVHR